MDLRPSPRQQELIDRAYAMASERFAPRAARHDRDASFPFDDYADLHSSGLLALCVPEQYGGLGADFETYCLVAEQIARGNAATALTYNMHALTMMMMGHFMKGSCRYLVVAGSYPIRSGIMFADILTPYISVITRNWQTFSISCKRFSRAD